METLIQIRPNVFKCQLCKHEVKSGLINVMEHYATCSARKIVFSLLFLMIPFAAFSQRTGTFSMNGVIITRTDTMEIADYNGKRDTCKVTWLSDKVYKVDGKYGAATARIYESGAWGYRAKVIDGKRTVWVELIKIKE